MKKIYTLFLALVLVSILRAQKPFEGIITYKAEIHEGERDQLKFEVMVYFGKQALLIKSRGAEQMGARETLVLFDSLKVYKIDHSDKTYFVNALTAFRMPPTGIEKNKTIAGYKTKSSEFSMSSVFTLMSLFREPSSFTFHTSPDLYFSIPDSLRSNPEVMMIGENGNILLGLDARSFTRSGPQQSVQLSISFEATAVSPMTLPVKDFMIPPDYKRNEEFTAAEMIIDSVAAVPDTIIADDAIKDEARPAPIAPPAPPPAKKKKTTPSPVRKPD